MTFDETFRPASNRWRRRLAAASALLAGIAGAAVVGPVLSSAPAGASTSIGTISTDKTTGTKPTPGSPVVAATAKINVISSAVDPVNGDVVELSTANQAFLIVNATNEPATDFGIGTGTLVKGDAYVIAGKGTTGWATPIANGTYTATTTALGGAKNVTFDSKGNLIVGGKTTSKTYIEVVAATTGTYYGQSMTPGLLYYIAGNAAGKTIPAPGITLKSPLTIDTITAVKVGTTLDVAFGTATSVNFLNYGASASLYGTTEAAGLTKIAGGGTGACTAGTQSLAISALPVTGPRLYADGSDNLYMANNIAPCTWVLPAANGSLTIDGTSTSVTAGNAYKVAGNGTEPFTVAPTYPAKATTTSIGCVNGITVDSQGNLVLAIDCGLGTKTALNGIDVVANSTGTFYGVSMTAGDVYVIAGYPGHVLNAAFDGPAQIGAYSSGSTLSLYFADITAHTLYKISATVTTAQSTTTTLTASPTGSQAFGTAVVLTAHMTPTSATGTVVFFVAGTTKLGTSTVTSGVATITTSALPKGTDSLTATFTPATPSAFKGSTSTALTYTVKTESSLTPTAPTIHSPTGQGFTVSVTVAPTGTFELTFKGTTKAVKLSAPKWVTKSGKATHNNLVATGQIKTWTLITTVNSVPGWTVTGKISTFVNSTKATYKIPGKDLGWVPHATDPTTTVTAGPSTTPGQATPSLANAAGSLWATAAATHGHGTTALSATLTLIFPETTHPGTYNAPFTVTAIQK